MEPALARKYQLQSFVGQKSMDETEIGILIAIAWFVVLVLGMTLIFFYQNYRTKLIEIEKEKQKIAFQAAVDAEENQKERTANNLHDEIIPLLTVLGRNIELHQKSLRKGDLDSKELENDTKLIEKAINAIRSVALDLIPNVLLNFGLIKALEHYVRETNKGLAAVELENRTSFQDSIFEKRTQVNIYRLCMEVLNNLKKHSYYKYLKIEIANNRNGMFIDIIHDGISISNEQIKEFTRKSNGLGLKSINARLVILNATIDYSIHESLARVLIYIPINNEKKS